MNTETHESHDAVAGQVDCRVRPWAVKKPWQVMLHYTPELGMLTMRAAFHTHGSIAFTESAAEYCGGEAERDEDGYIIRCHEELEQVDVAREIARMSSMA
ncbi:MAG: hypothetical protein ACRC1H_15070 [Caldilineaceae bacterium]